MLFEKIELEPSENVLKVVRKHWFIILGQLLGTVVLLLIPFFAILATNFLPKETTLNLITNFSSPLIIFGVSLWSLLTLLSGFMIWTNYYLDLWIITDKRIIVVDQIHFFSRKVSSFRLERLQDMEVSVKGIIATFLDFGTLDAHTASGSTEENFRTIGLPEPRELQALIQKATDARLTSLHSHTTQILN